MTPPIDDRREGREGKDLADDGGSGAAEYAEQSHTLMDEYMWPLGGERLAERASARWADTVAALPEGREVTARVVGRQPFGVFVEIIGVPDALGLAEITTMPPDAALPLMGTVVRGTVIGHASHNHQVKLRLLDHRD